MTGDRHNPPLRLSHRSRELNALLTDAERSYRSGLDEARAWERLSARMSRESRRTGPARMGWWVAAAAAVALLIGWFGWPSVRPGSGAVTVTSIARQPERAEATTSIRLGSGKSMLPDGTEVELSTGTEGTFSSDERRSAVEFERGRLEIGVAPQTQGRHFAVKTAGYEFVVLGTRFSVSVDPPTVTLRVIEGRVAVQSASKTVEIVEAGGIWSNAPGATPTASVEPSVIRTPAVDHTPRSETPSASSQPLTDPSHCRDLLRDGHAGQAERCYLDMASGSGLSAEMALYEVARLRRDVLSNPTSALAALDDYEARFGSGTLAPEVKMARIDILARLGRVDEALSASSQLLTTSSGRARTLELRLLRGNLLREQKHDCAAAEAEYRPIAHDPGPRGEQAEFALASCLERLGRRTEAIGAYRSYLARPKPQQADRARQRLEELEP